jgi:nucleotide-binding universal stress UspA family protein
LEDRSYIGRSGNFRHFLVGMDGSDQARTALLSAMALARDVGGEVAVVVVVVPPVHAETDDDLSKVVEAEESRLRELLGGDGFRSGVSSVSSEVVVSADPARTLADYAEHHGCDLIVMGAHGRERVSHGGLGRSLETLLRKHPCPVMVV